MNAVMSATTEATTAPVATPEVAPALRQVEPESKYAAETWDFNFDVLNEIVAKAPFSIKKPIRVWESQATKAVGSHRFREAGDYHAVYASRKIDGDAASAAIYDQLVECVKHENEKLANDEKAVEKLTKTVEALKAKTKLTVPFTPAGADSK